MEKIFSYFGGPVGVNTYVVASENLSAVVIDPSDIDKLCKILSDNRLELKAVLLTHGHFDHIWALVALTKRFSVPVYIHPLDIPMLTDPSINAARLFGFDRADIFRFSAPLPVNDGDRITVDTMTFNVIHTPGHSRGCVSYYIDNVIFTGDTLFRSSVGRTDGYGGSFDELMLSLRKFDTYDPSTVIYPGHGPSSTLSHERQFNPYLRHSIT